MTTLRSSCLLLAFLVIMTLHVGDEVPRFESRSMFCRVFQVSKTDTAKCRDPTPAVKIEAVTSTEPPQSRSEGGHHVGPRPTTTSNPTKIANDNPGRCREMNRRQPGLADRD